MKIVRLQAEGFKRLRAIDITPDGDLIEVRGNNAEGKSSLLDSIMAALGGAEAAPLKPVRTGEAYAIIRADLGDVKVTRYFDADGTTTLKVQNAEGFNADKPQNMLDSLVGRIAFDPLAFARMPAKDQAAELRRLVPLPVDLDAMAKADREDALARRDVNRDGKAVKARLDVMPVEIDLPETRPDLDGLTKALASAADTNSAIDRERLRREDRARDADRARAGAEQQDSSAKGMRDEAARLIAQAVDLEGLAAGNRERGAAIDAEVAALPPLDSPVDTEATRKAIDQARADLERMNRADVRAGLVAEFDALKARSAAFTTEIEARAALRAKALAEAVMPVPGLSLMPFGDDDDLIVSLDGEPFSQASSAQQLRASMGLAMAANPKLRVMLIKDGSLLDPKGLAIVREMATAGDYQVWLEAVGEGDGVGLIMEDGAIRGAPEPERVEPPKRRKPKAEGDAPEGEAEQSTGDQPKASPAPQAKSADKAKPAPQAMRQFTTAKPGDLFGGDS